MPSAGYNGLKWLMYLARAHHQYRFICKCIITHREVHALI